MNQFLKKLFKHPVVLDEEGTSRLNSCTYVLSALLLFSLLYSLGVSIIFNVWKETVYGGIWALLLIYLLFKIQSGSNVARVLVIAYILFISFLIIFTFDMDWEHVPKPIHYMETTISAVSLIGFIYSFFSLIDSNVKAELKARKDAANKINTTTEMES